MSKLITKIILTVLMIPISNSLGALLGYLFSTNTIYFRPQNNSTWIIMLGKYIFVVAYLVLLWRTSIRWTARRVRLTMVIFTAILLIGALGFWVFRAFPIQAVRFAAYTLDQMIPITWLLATTLIWRETDVERIDRLSQSGTDVISCPTCGYSMNGLETARCPECGAQFTIDALVKAQHSHEQEELSQA